jgi:hypothetical protein
MNLLDKRAVIDALAKQVAQLQNEAAEPLTVTVTRDDDAFQEENTFVKLKVHTVNASASPEDYFVIELHRVDGYGLNMQLRAPRLHPNLVVRPLANSGRTSRGVPMALLSVHPFPHGNCLRVNGLVASRRGVDGYYGTTKRMTLSDLIRPALTVKLPPDVKSMYGYEIQRGVIQKVSQSRQFDREANNLARVVREVYGSLFTHSGLQREYIDLVKISASRPVFGDFALANLIGWDNIRAVIDTPIVVAAYMNHVRTDIAKRVKPRTIEAGLQRARSTTPADITRYSKKYFDPDSVMSPRHWRWLTRQHPRAVRKIYGDLLHHTATTPQTRKRQAQMVALCADHFPDIIKYWPVVHEYVLGAATRVRNERTDIVHAAVKKYLDGKPDARLAWSTPHRWLRILDTVIEKPEVLPVNGDTKRASLAHLHAITEHHMPIPEAARRYGDYVCSLPIETPREYEGVLFTPIKTNAEAYRESQEIGHCLFTGWSDRLKTGKYYAYRVSDVKTGVACGTAVYSSRRDPTHSYHRRYTHEQRGLKVYYVQFDNGAKRSAPLGWAKIYEAVERFEQVLSDAQEAGESR